LWIAFKICIFDFQKQQKCVRCAGYFVVNCFQNLYLWLSETAEGERDKKIYLLWIAFKICIFDFQKQHNQRLCVCNGSCELLSKFVSLTFRNSHFRHTPHTLPVVNCFQNLYLWLSETANTLRKAAKNLLWIAFKICIFDFQKQRTNQSNLHRCCCELLSKFVSLTFRNSFGVVAIVVVWRCELLSKFVSLTFRNSVVANAPIAGWLWIAFKICIFDFQKQQMKLQRLVQNSCELLSKFVSLTFRNSVCCAGLCGRAVVNCFQNLYLWLSETAKSC